MSTATADHNQEIQEDVQSPLAHLSEEQIEELAKEFDAIHDEVYADLGEHDRRYITSMIELHRRLAVMSRVALLAADFRPAWVFGTVTNSTAKILENMEIGHNVMHGQWDWMNDPQIHSSTWDWDTASTAEAWKHSHNYVHHTFTNIRGKDKDLGYEIMRIDPHQKWHPVYLFQPIYNAILMALFEWGVALHDMDLEAIRHGEKSHKEALQDLKGIGVKARAQIVKDYVGWPAISGLAAGAADFVVRRDKEKAIERAKSTFKKASAANATANVVRNLWAHAIIFCGHFPDQTYTFSQEETED
ncbi:MAG: acyl-CoA desaturase, partial [Actinomycetota bacterium]|nr:acyl-CoA desaturase [Actinomycetota bacterium]